MRGHAIQDCAYCEGRGSFLSEDWDEYGRIAIRVKCEGCDGSGMTGVCRSCFEPAALPVLEDRSGLCCGCALRAEVGDAAEEMIRLGRGAQ